jgi:DNA-directed RNA polymerase
MELKAALDSPDPYAYECALPVHQDGTCNGLQHYAALGGDARGARQVNLDITDRPSDVYTYVANMVEKRMREDLERNPENKFAQMLVGKIARKVVKQTVMTTVYGVTFVGAREQIERQLKDRGDVPLEECYLAAAYLAKQVRRSCLFSQKNVFDFAFSGVAMHRRLVPGSERHHELADCLCAYNLEVRARRSPPRGRGARPDVEFQKTKRYHYSPAQGADGCRCVDDAVRPADRSAIPQSQAKADND